MTRFNLPTLVTLTAPTCAGKSFLLEAMVDRLGFSRIVSTTDRAPREGEIEGVHYFFINTEQSKELEAQGKLAELITYNGTRYGVTHEEMAKKVSVDLPPPIVILEPKGLQIYKEYCNSKGWKMFTIYVETNEGERLRRLAIRTRNDILLALRRNEDNFKNFASELERLIAVNNKRLKAVIEEERMWSHQNRWDVQVDGTNVEKALADIQHGIEWRNSRPEIYA